MRRFDGAFEHGDHFGRVASTAEHDEEVGGLVRIAPAMAERSTTLRIEDGSHTEEDAEEGEGYRCDDDEKKKHADHSFDGLYIDDNKVD